ncbi:MAG: ABC transporter ATP-binding protein [Alphaproteobacteria bacterium]|jgi:putative ABC transport system ATP-binding protein|nr:ABC transporter ATP-binding protein [Alphaproteobacteria bacterium]
MSQSIIVECRGIKKTFESGGTITTALRGVDLSVNQGEFFMLVGPSGCGKTTFISVIAGILTPDEGVCHVHNKSYADLSKKALLSFRSKEIGFIFQAFNLIPSLSVAENVAIPLIIQGHPTEKALGQARTILMDVGLQDKTEMPPSRLSGGQQQRVAIARALIHSPSLVICDEPTSALDHESGQMILTLMKEMSRRVRTTFVIVTHDPRIFTYADRIAHMDDGRITKIETQEESHHVL